MESWGAELHRSKYCLVMQIRSPGNLLECPQKNRWKLGMVTSPNLFFSPVVDLSWLFDESPVGCIWWRGSLKTVAFLLERSFLVREGNSRDNPSWSFAKENHRDREAGEDQTEILVLRLISEAFQFSKHSVWQSATFGGIVFCAPTPSNWNWHIICNWEIVKQLF